MVRFEESSFQGSGWQMHHDGKDQALVLSGSFQQPGELVQFHWNIKQARTQVTRKQGLEAPTFLSRCTGAALEPLDRWREADGATETSLVPTSNSPGAAENETEQWPHPVKHTSQLLLYTPMPLCTHTHTLMYVIKYKASKQAHFKRNTLFLRHKENGNDDYTSSVEAFMNTM